MKTLKLNLLLVAASIIILSSCSTGFTIGSTEILEEDREVSEFENIEIEGIYETFITHGDKTEVTIVANANILDNIHTNVQNKTLAITMDQREYDNISIDILITVPTVKEITKRGVGSTNVKGFFDLDDLEINHFGLASFTMEGSADNLSLNKTGIGNFDAFDLEVESCQVEQTGIGNTRITCTKSLTGELTGIGNIYYKGRPHVNVDVTGIGNVKDAN